MIWFIIVLWFISPTFAVNYTTIPDTDSGLAYVFANEGTENVSIYCVVIINGVQFQSRWRVKRLIDSDFTTTDYSPNGDLISPAGLIGDITATGELIPGSSLTYETNFTILNFTNEFNLTEVQCGPQGTDLRLFIFGFPGI